MLLPLAYYGNPILRKKAQNIEKITPEIRQLVSDMIETVKEQNGVGLAAPQVHQSVALFIILAPIEQPDGTFLFTDLHIFINPKITSASKEMCTHGEGCLSIPKLYSDVDRPETITVKAMDLEGNEFEKEFHGYVARQIMHENDHLNGILFIDRIHGKRRKELEPALQAIKKQYASKK